MARLVECAAAVHANKARETEERLRLELDLHLLLLE